MENFTQSGYKPQMVLEEESWLTGFYFTYNSHLSGISRNCHHARLLSINCFPAYSRHPLRPPSTRELHANLKSIQSYKIVLKSGIGLLSDT
jgi:hypothetical protein